MSNDKECKHYPCHFPGQGCKYCFCPFYPCHDYELGFWVIGRRGRVLWSCIDCHLLHIPEVEDLYSRNPELTLEELKAFAIRKGFVYVGRKSTRHIEKIVMI